MRDSTENETESTISQKIGGRGEGRQAARRFSFNKEAS